MRKLLCFLSLVICCLTAVGQDVEIKEKINKIKKSTSYICAEATLPTKEEAYSLANDLLMTEINHWINKEGKLSEALKFLKKDNSTKKIKQIVIEDINSCHETYDMKRGNSVRAFVFVKKSQIIPIYGDAHIIINSDKTGNGIQSLDSLNQEQAPKVDTLIITQKETIKDSIQNIAAKKIAIVSIDTVVDMTVAVKENKQAVEVEKYSKEEALKSIMNAGNMANIKPIFKNLKAENKIRYNKATLSTSIDPKSYLLIFDKTKRIVAILAPGSTVRKNLFNQKDVKLSDFEGCGAYWFILD